MFFNTRVDIGEGADSARNGAGGDFLARMHKAFAAAGEFGIGLRELQAESNGLGVDAMRATDDGGHLVLEGAALDGREQSVDVGEQEVGGARELDGETGVEHVRRGHALMDEA